MADFRIVPNQALSGTVLAGFSVWAAQTSESDMDAAASKVVAYQEGLPGGYNSGKVAIVAWLENSGLVERVPCATLYVSVAQRESGALIATFDDVEVEYELLKPPAPGLAI